MSSSSSDCRLDGTEPLLPPPATTLMTVPARDWAQLPSDILLDIFLRLGPREVMLGSEFACKPWRCVALEEPALWRCVGFEFWRPLYRDERWIRVIRRCNNDMRLFAVDRAQGQCEAFEGNCINADSLLDLVGRAPALKILNIEGFSRYESGKVIVEALQKLTLLEDLEIDFRHFIAWDEDALQSVCQACPHLEKLVLKYALEINYESNEHDFKEPIDGPIPVMGKLHTLKLYDCDLSTEGLNAILDSCPLLETLHIDGYFNKHKMDKELRHKCTRVKNLTLDTITWKKPRGWYYYGYVEEYFGFSSGEDSEISSQEEDYDSEEE